jgi:hypothetical protein
VNSEHVLANEYKLNQNYPNPFNPITKISIDLPRDSRINLVIYDVLGRIVKRLVYNEFKAAGSYTYEFNGTSFPSGVYFYRFDTDNFTATKKFVLLK